MESPLWLEAANRVDPKLQPELQKFKRLKCDPQDLLKLIEDKRDECIKKQWTYKNFKGQSIPIRAILEKVSLWLNKVRGIGDVISSFDPGHAALPWACIRFLITVVTSDIQQHGAMIDSLELLASVISRYTLIEQIYCRRCVTEAESKVRTSIVSMYSAILEYLCKRFMKAIAHLDNDPDEIEHDIKRCSVDVDMWIKLVDHESQNNSNIHLEEISQDMDELKDILKGWQPLLTSKLESISDGLQKNERIKILKWISTEEYVFHHKTIAKQRLVSTGSWMLKRLLYREWKYRAKTPFLWLKGSPGTGKSILASLVIDDLRGENGEDGPPIAYFYCTRDPSEPRRADSTEVLLSLLKQLASSHPEHSAKKTLVPSVVAKWHQRLDMGSQHRLDQDESIAIITEICSVKGAYIVIDALDECPRQHQQNIMDSLRTITQNSTVTVRVFVSSRLNSSIGQYFDEHSCIEILSKSNSHDIKKYVLHELDKKIKERKFLRGTPPSQLVTEVQDAIIERADSIFRWAAASIETLCGLSHEADVRAQLESLPRGLNAIYAIIMRQIDEGGIVTKELAKKVLHWLLCAQQPLRTEEIIHTLSDDSNATVLVGSITTDQILDWCCNLVKYDAEQQVIRFVHLSVREYLETEQPQFQKSKCNESIALACIRQCVTGVKPRRKAFTEGVESKTFYDYAMVYWPLHCANAGEYRKEGTLAKALTNFLYKNKKLVAESFLHFLRNWRDSWDALGLKEITDAESKRKVKFDNNAESTGELRNKLEDSENGPMSPIFLACAFGFTEILEEESNFTNTDAEKQNDNYRHPLNIAVRHNQIEVVDLITKKVHFGFGDFGDTSLIAAVSMNRGTMVTKLLDENHLLEISQLVIDYALQSASISVVEYIMSHERCVPFDVTNTLLQSASQNTVDGYVIVKSLLARDRVLGIEDETIEVACSNRKFGVQILHALLERKHSFVPTEVAYGNAAANDELGIDLLRILSSITTGIKISEYMIDNAAGNSSLEPMEFLLNQDRNFQVTRSNLISACRNDEIGIRMLELLLDRSNTVLVDEGLFVAAINNKKIGTQLIKILLTRTTREKLPITTEFMIEAAEKRSGKLLLETLLPECVGMPIHPMVMATAAANEYSPVEMLTILFQHDPLVEITKETCLNAVRNPQYAVELVEFLQPHSRSLFESPKVLEQIPSNDQYGLELVERVWSFNKPDVSEAAVEAAVDNKNGDKILAHWYAAGCKIPISSKAVEYAFASSKALEVFKMLLKINKKLPIPPRAISEAARHRRAPDLIRAIARHLGRQKSVANEEVFFRAVLNPASGGEVIDILLKEFKHKHAITPALIECISGYEITPTAQRTLFKHPEAAASITSDAAECALSGNYVLVVLDTLLEANPNLELSVVAWERLFAAQKTPEAIVATFECFAKHNRKPLFSERVLLSILKRYNSLRLYLCYLAGAKIMNQNIPITTEIIHACMKMGTNQKGMALETVLGELDDPSSLELTNQLCEDLLRDRQAHDLIAVFEKFELTIPMGPLDSPHIQYAIVNRGLGDDILEKLLNITPDQRRLLCRSEGCLIAIIKTNSSPQKILSGVERPLPITTRVLILAIRSDREVQFWLRSAFEQDPQAFPALITKELIVTAAENWIALEELHSLSLQLDFDLPVSSRAFMATLSIEPCSFYRFRILTRCVIKQGGVDKLLSLLTPECLVWLSTSDDWRSIIYQILYVFFSQDNVRALYSEPMLTVAARNCDVTFINWAFDDILDPKPKGHYLDIVDLYNTISNGNLLRARELLDKGVDPNIRNRRGLGFLATCCVCKELAMVKLAMKYGTVDINSRDEDGDTPLIIAARIGNYGIVEVLLKGAPEVHHRDVHEGKTAEEWARWNGHYGIAEMIKTNSREREAQSEMIRH